MPAPRPAWAVLPGAPESALDPGAARPGCRRRARRRRGRRAWRPCSGGTPPGPRRSRCCPPPGRPSAPAPGRRRLPALPRQPRRRVRGGDRRRRAGPLHVHGALHRRRQPSVGARGAAPGGPCPRRWRRSPTRTARCRPGATAGRSTASARPVGPRLPVAGGLRLEPARRRRRAPPVAHHGHRQGPPGPRRGRRHQRAPPDSPAASPAGSAPAATRAPSWRAGSGSGGRTPGSSCLAAAAEATSCARSDVCRRSHPARGLTGRAASVRMCTPGPARTRRRRERARQPRPDRPAPPLAAARGRRPAGGRPCSPPAPGVWAADPADPCRREHDPRSAPRCPPPPRCATPRLRLVGAREAASSPWQERLEVQARDGVLTAVTATGPDGEAVDGGPDAGRRLAGERAHRARDDVPGERAGARRRRRGPDAARHGHQHHAPGAAVGRACRPATTGSSASASPSSSASTGPSRASRPARRARGPAGGAHPPRRRGRLALDQQHRAALPRRVVLARPAPRSTSSPTCRTSRCPGGVWGSGRRTTTFTVGRRADQRRRHRRKHTMTVSRDGKVLRVLKASMGKPQFATRNGTFLVLEKFEEKVMDSDTRRPAAQRGGVPHRGRARRAHLQQRHVHPRRALVGRRARAGPTSATAASTSPPPTRSGSTTSRSAATSSRSSAARRGPLPYDAGSMDWNMPFATWRAGA